MVRPNWVACCILPVMLWGCQDPPETKDLVAGSAAIALPAGGVGGAGAVAGGGAAVASGAAGVAVGGAIVATATATDGGVLETHGATTPDGCRALAKRFNEWGRNVELIEVKRNEIGSGGVLEWQCTFAGPDAEIGYDGFNDSYNNGEIADD